MVYLKRMERLWPQSKIHSRTIKLHLTKRLELTMRKSRPQMTRPSLGLPPFSTMKINLSPPSLQSKLKPMDLVNLRLNLLLLTLLLSKSKRRKRRSLPRSAETSLKLAHQSKGSLWQKPNTQSLLRHLLKTAQWSSRRQSPNPKRATQRAILQGVKSDSKNLPSSPRRREISKSR